MIVYFTIAITVVIIYLLYRQLLKIDKCEYEKIDDFDAYIKSLLQDYPVNDVTDMVKLTQGLIDVQRIIEDKDVTNVSLKAVSLSNLWTNDSNNHSVKKIADIDANALWNKILEENSIDADRESFYKHQILNDFFDRIKEIIMDMPNRIRDENILDQLKYDILTIIWLLALLDKKGDCPSVVNVIRDDANYKNDYAVLSRYTLLDHSIRVANKAMALLEKDDTGYFILLPVVIAALGHDIGKIPEYINKEEYTKYQHSSISITILRKSSFFKLIPDERRNLIDKAILEHHGLVLKDKDKNNNPILDKLKEADKMSREEEITLYRNQNDQKDEFNINIIGDIISKKDEFNSGIINDISKDKGSVTAEDNASVQQEPIQQPEEKQEESIPQQEQIQQEKSQEEITPQEEPMQQPEIKQEEPIQQVPIQQEIVEPNNQYIKPESDTKIKPFMGEKNNDTEIADIPVVNEEFLNEFISRIRMKINEVKKYYNPKAEIKVIYKFNAFTVQNSVYATSFFLTNTLVNLFKEFGDMKTAEIMSEEERRKRLDGENVDKPYTRAILLYILKYLRNNGFISEEAFKSDFIGGYFDIYDEFGVTLHSKAYYTVFNIEMFVKPGDTVESTIQELEKRKRVDDNNYLLKFNKIYFHK